LGQARLRIVTVRLAVQFMERRRMESAQRFDAQQTGALGKVSIWLADRATPVAGCQWLPSVRALSPT
jgi:hypothetical protein